MVEEKNVFQVDSMYLFLQKHKPPPPPRNQNDVITVCVPRHVH